MVTTEKRIDHLRREVRRKPELCIERAVLFTESYKETFKQHDYSYRGR
jgi:hypothetical protein